MSLGYDTLLPRGERRRRGAWFTPASLVDQLVQHTLPAVRPGETVRVLDPACGDGRFLFAAAAWIRERGGVPSLTGVDIDLGAIDLATAGEPVELIEADALHLDWGTRTFDAVIGNPPFLSQLASATARLGGSRFGGGPYADAAADFLAMSVRLATADGGRVGLVLPASVLTARDAGPIRQEVSGSASMHWFWWSPEPVFDAEVRTCAIGLHRGGAGTRIERSTGVTFQPGADLRRDIRPDEQHWGWLIADSLGVPEVPPVQAIGTLADHGLVTANFRDQYYGLVGAVGDDVEGPPLITTGLIDVNACLWGLRSTRFAKQSFDRPRVDRSGLVPFMQRWVDRCLVPKVLVATQTRVLEAVADVDGAWLPAVPVVRVVPATPADLWAVAAVLTSPVASALVAAQSVGSGLSASTVRVSQRTLGALPWPAGDLTAAQHALRHGDIAACGRLVDAAYGLNGCDQLTDWWLANV